MLTLRILLGAALLAGVIRLVFQVVMLKYNRLIENEQALKEYYYKLILEEDKKNADNISHHSTSAPKAR